MVRRVGAAHAEQTGGWTEHGGDLHSGPTPRGSFAEVDTPWERKLPSSTRACVRRMVKGRRETEGPDTGRRDERRWKDGRCQLRGSGHRKVQLTQNADRGLLQGERQILGKRPGSLPKLPTGGCQRAASGRQRWSRLGCPPCPAMPRHPTQRLVPNTDQAGTLKACIETFAAASALTHRSP